MDVLKLINTGQGPIISDVVVITEGKIFCCTLRFSTENLDTKIEFGESYRDLNPRIEYKQLNDIFITC